MNLTHNLLNMERSDTYSFAMFNLERHWLSPLHVGYVIAALETCQTVGVLHGGSSN